MQLFTFLDKTTKNILQPDEKDKIIIHATIYYIKKNLTPFIKGLNFSEGMVKNGESKNRYRRTR